MDGRKSCKHLLLSSILVLLPLLMIPAEMHAHAVVIDSSPADGARLARPPSQIVLRFNARIEKSLSRLRLETGGGHPLPLPQLPAQTSSKEEGNSLLIPLPPLGPGGYQLRFKILSTDGHATLGVLRFTVTGGP